MSQTFAENALSEKPHALTTSRLKRTLPRFISALLIFAATAKGYEVWRVPSTWSALQVGSEIALAVWLMRGFQIHWVMRVTASVFSIYALITLWKISQGDGSCGCFGPIIVPPVFTFVLDAAIVLLLIVTTSFPIAAKTVIAIFLIVISIITLQTARRHGAMVAAALIQPAQSPATQLAATSPSTQPAAGEASAAKQYDAIAKQDSPTLWTADLGKTSDGQTVHVLFSLANPSDHVLAIRGVNVSCGCTSVPQPPQTIAKDGKTNVEVIVRILDHSGPWDSTVSLTTDMPTLPPLSLIVKGHLP